MPTSEPPYPEVPERRRFTIGQAAVLARSKPHILRYWEKEIAPLAKVERRNGRRYYSREQVLMLQQIGRMLEGGATLAGVARRFAAPGKRSADSADWLRRELEDVLAIL